jgi:hypothetical protein
MKQGKTKTGFEFELSESIANDYEVVELLSELEDNPLVLTKLVVKILGKEQATRLKNHVRDENGTVPTDKMTREIIDIFQGSDETKNS